MSDIATLTEEVRQMKAVLAALNEKLAPAQKPKTLTVKQYAELKGVSEWTVRQHCAAGKIPCRGGGKPGANYEIIME